MYCLPPLSLYRPQNQGGTYVITINEPTETHHSLSPKVHTLHQGSLMASYTLSFDKCLTCVHHYRII